MSDADLLLIVPTRGRPEQCKRLLASLRETTDSADVAFVLDPDDEDKYEDVEWGDALRAVLAPRGTLSDKLNQTAMAMADTYRAIAWSGDDHVFQTPHWDTLLLAELDDMGGDGWVYPATRRGSDAPEIWLASSTVTRFLGWFYPPFLAHFGGAQAIAEIGKRAGLLRFAADVVAEHKHWSVDPSVEHDATYREAEEAHAQPDTAAWQQWRPEQASYDVSRLRRQFSRDVSWVISKVA